MSNNNTMKEAFANLRFPKHIKEGATAGKDYKDAKSFQQFYADTKRLCEKKKAVYQKALEAFKPDENIIRLLETDKYGKEILEPMDLSKGDKWLMVKVTDVDRMDEQYNAFHNAMVARRGIKRMERLPDMLKELKNFEDNEATKNGVEALNTAIQSSDPLLALVLSTGKDDSDEDKELI